jgi:diketogulonate reductase-like aldo/keto reductase
MLSVMSVALLAASAAVIPTLEIAPGVKLPMAGLGTWQYNDTVAGEATALALSLGYTHIDTAIGYKNQVGIGKALKASSRPRDSYFITSKIPGGLSTADATAQLELSNQQLQLDYVDLMLVHFPASWGGVGGKTKRQEQWKAMEAFQKAGKAKAIGVSHYCERHLDDILEIATIKPAVNQVEFHVGMGLQGLNATDIPFPKKPSEQPSYKGVAFEAFSSLCGPCGTSELINGTFASDIGKKHGKSAAQVSLKWVVQQGIPVLPKTHKKEYMLENIDLFNWELTDEEMTALSAHVGKGITSPDGSGDCTVE